MRFTHTLIHRPSLALALPWLFFLFKTVYDMAQTRPTTWRTAAAAAAAKSTENSSPGSAKHKTVNKYT